jgi:hypothetical protein
MVAGSSCSPASVEPTLPLCTCYIHIIISVILTKVRYFVPEVAHGRGQLLQAS